MPPFQPAPTADDRRDALTYAVCDLLARSEEAALRGSHDCAARFLGQAERAAFAGGDLSLVRLIWRHTPSRCGQPMA
jgi:hypothetical protein